MLAPYLFIICLDYVLRTSIDNIKENGFVLTKKRSRGYPAKTITDADYVDDIVLLANTPNRAETLLHSLERAAAGVGLHVNAHKTEFMCFNQKGDISTLDRKSLKLVDKFTYLGSSVSSTEKDIDTRLTKAWTDIDRLSIIWKSNLADKIKRSFFQAAVVSILLYGCTTWTLTKRLERKLDGNYTRILPSRELTKNNVRSEEIVMCEQDPCCQHALIIIKLMMIIIWYIVFSCHLKKCVTSSSYNFFIFHVIKHK